MYKNMLLLLGACMSSPHIAHAISADSIFSKYQIYVGFGMKRYVQPKLISYGNELYQHRNYYSSPSHNLSICRKWNRNILSLNYSKSTLFYHFKYNFSLPPSATYLPDVDLFYDFKVSLLWNREFSITADRLIPIRHGKINAYCGAGLAVFHMPEWYMKSWHTFSFADTSKNDILYFKDNHDIVRFTYLNPQLRAGIYYKLFKRYHQVNLTLNWGNFTILRGDYAFYNIDPLSNHGTLDYKNVYGAVEFRFGLFRKFNLL